MSEESDRSDFFRLDDTRLEVNYAIANIVTLEQCQTITTSTKG